MDRGKSFIGTSGWSYPHWGKGVFYPVAVPQREWLSYYSERFKTVEINNTFYRLPQKTVCEHWGYSVPAHFRFVVKASRYITHIKKLSRPEKPLIKFLENVSALKKKLAVLLFQLPPSFKVDHPRLAQLLDILQNQSIAPGVKIAFEFRNRTWLDSETIRLLRERNFALCFADWSELTITEPATADFIYLRRHGPQDAYNSCYSESEIARDAQRIEGWLSEGKDVYVYYNNDAEGWAVKNALTLLEMVS